MIPGTGSSATTQSALGLLSNIPSRVAGWFRGKSATIATKIKCLLPGGSGTNNLYFTLRLANFLKLVFHSCMLFPAPPPDPRLGMTSVPFVGLVFMADMLRPQLPRPDVDIASIWAVFLY